jgi:hypothetical protein
MNIDYMTELAPPELISKPVITKDDLETINALSHSQMSLESPWSADFIKNKGEGVVVLLHGQHQSLCL